MMAGGALLSFVLLRTSPNVPAPVAKEVQAKQDYFVERFVMANYQGSIYPSLLVTGQHGAHLLNEKKTEVEKLVFRSRDPQYERWGSADTAELDDQDQFLVMNQNVIFNQKKLQAGGADSLTHVTSQHLRVDQEAKLLTTTGNVKIERGKHTIRADAMRYDYAQQNMVLSGNVKMTVAPAQPPARSGAASR